MNNTKFIVDSEVRLKNNKKVIGFIVRIISVLEEGNTLYLVDFPQGLKMVAEKDLEASKSEVRELKEVSLYDISVNIEVEDKIDEIIEQLGLVNSDDPNIVLSNACKLQRYLIETCSVVKKYVGSMSNNIYYNELYNGLIIGDRNYLTNSLIFKETMKRVGATVHAVAMQDNKGLFYVSNLVLIGNEYYYFDVTLDTEVYLESDEDEELKLCCAGLGKEKYERYFKPVAILEYDPKVPNRELPSNIAIEDIKNCDIK